MPTADIPDAWDTGNHRRPRWRWLGILAALLAVAAAGWAVRTGSGLRVDAASEGLDDGAVQGRDAREGGSRDVEIVARAPLRAAGSGRWFCSPDFPVATHDDRRAYPPGHPATPRGQAPTTCYRDLGVAIAAGYAEAPLPVGTIQVGGLYLVRTDRFRAPCRQAARQLGHPVGCPGVLPSPVSAAQCAGTGVARCVYRRPASVGFIVVSTPSRPRGTCYDCEPYIAVTTARRGRAGILSGCPPAAVYGGRAQGLGSDVVACPDGPPWQGGGGYPHQGHLLRRWVHGGVVFAVSVDGEGPSARAVLRAVANGVRKVARG